MEEYINDETLAAEVSKKLMAIAGDTSNVRVEVENGIIYLDGVVSNSRLLKEIEDTICNTAGLDKVVNSIVVEHIVNLAESGYNRPNWAED